MNTSLLLTERVTGVVPVCGKPGLRCSSLASTLPLRYRGTLHVALPINDAPPVRVHLGLDAEESVRLFPLSGAAQAGLERNHVCNRKKTLLGPR